MTINEALQALKFKVQIPFGQFMSEEELTEITKENNKGIVGQVIENILGLQHTSALLDFVDGELKTNKFRDNGTPAETIAITLISSSIDNLLDDLPFIHTHLFDKIRNMLLVPIAKGNNDARQWKIIDCFIMSYWNSSFQDIYHEIAWDYIHIRDDIKQLLMPPNNGFLKTITKTYLQIRPKDVRPYRCIYSNKLGRYISDRQYAFYFRKTLMKELLLRLHVTT